MKIINAKLFEEEIKNKFWEIWYDEKYQYYFGGNYRRDFEIIDSENGINRDFAIIGDKGDVIGYIGYTFDTELKIAKWFGAINFSNQKVQFGMALKQVIYDCFNKFGADLVSFEVIVGNPVECEYDRLCEKVGGRVVGIKSNRAVNMKGEKCNVKEYEIKREDFLK